jgi:hypothetical protein
MGAARERARSASLYASWAASWKPCSRNDWPRKTQRSADAVVRGVFDVVLVLGDGDVRRPATW